MTSTFNDNSSVLLIPWHPSDVVRVQTDPVQSLLLKVEVEREDETLLGGQKNIQTGGPQTQQKHFRLHWGQQVRLTWHRYTRTLTQSWLKKKKTLTCLHDDTCDFTAVSVRLQNVTVTTGALEWAVCVITVVWTDGRSARTLIHINTHQTAVYRLITHPTPTALHTQKTANDIKWWPKSIQQNIFVPHDIKIIYNCIINNKWMIVILQEV